MCLSSSEFLMYLKSRVGHSEASRFLTLEYIGQVGEHEFRMSLNGPDGDFRVEIEHDLARVRIMGECIWFVDERARGEVAPRVREGDVAYAGPIWAGPGGRSSCPARSVKSYSRTKSFKASAP